MGVEFHLYGDGTEKTKIARYIAENSGCDIFMHESVPKSEMPEILAQYHATIVPLTTHIRGAFPSKIYMAMSASLPVLFCGSGEGAQFVRELNIGWVTGPGDYQDLKGHIEDLASMAESDYLLLRKHIKSVATSRFDLDDQLDRLVDFIDRIA